MAFLYRIQAERWDALRTGICKLFREKLKKVEKSHWLTLYQGYGARL